MHFVSLGYPVAFWNGCQDGLGRRDRPCRSGGGEEAGVDIRGTGPRRYGIRRLELFGHHDGCALADSRQLHFMQGAGEAT